MKEQRKSLCGSALAEASLVLLAQALWGPVSHLDLTMLLQRVLPAENLPAKSDLLRPLSKFVVGDGDTVGYALGHPRVGDFLRKQYAGTQLSDNATRAYLSWGEEVMSELQTTTLPEHVPAYVLSWYPRHVLQCNSSSLVRLQSFLSNEWISACRVGGREASFAVTAEAILGVLLGRLPDRQGIPIPEAVSSAMRASLLLTSVRESASHLDIDLLVTAFEHGLIGQQALLDRKALLNPTGRVALLLRLASTKRPEFSAITLWREACAVTYTIPSQRRGELLDQVLWAAQRVFANVSVAERGQLWTEVLALVKQRLDAPFRWPIGVDFPPFPYLVSQTS